MTDKIDSETMKLIEKYPDSYRWELVEAFRKRSDEAANYLRALLLAISTAGAGFLFNKNYNGPISWHHLSIMAFIIAIALIVWSWDRQKSKAIARLIELRDKGYQEYLNLEKCLAKFRKNETIDRASYAFIGLAVFVEALLVILGKTH